MRLALLEIAQRFLRGEILRFFISFFDQAIKIPNTGIYDPAHIKQFRLWRVLKYAVWTLSTTKALHTTSQMAKLFLRTMVFPIFESI